MKPRQTRLKVTEENITTLLENEIFVFGSNLKGAHGAGAALLAKNKFGAELGVGEGITGQCYALPTKNENIETMSINDIYKCIEVLLKVVKNTPNKFFKITAVGCGLAGYAPSDVAPMFENFICLPNISLPQSFIDVILPTVIKGYKVTDANMKCRNFQFELGKKFTIDKDIVICKKGFHFCRKLVDCFNYYSFNPNNRVFEVEGYEEFDFEQDKIATKKLKIIKELNWYEVLKMSNQGLNNTGHKNTGDSNTGHSNTGHKNTGDSNTGHKNTGDSNTGHKNTGDSNTGDSNTGHKNTGDKNTGHKNTGHSNTGHKNTGDKNTGHSNTGHKNTGDSNTGHSNTGDSNTGHSNTGCFNTNEPNARMFNKLCNKKMREINIPSLYIPLTDWIYESNMTDLEKQSNPKFYVQKGYLKTNDYKTAWGIAWNSADKSKKQEFLNLPNFDANIFEEITGIKV
jgi:PPE-repeat protein